MSLKWTNLDNRNISTALLSSGLVFSVATQLRLPGWGFGLGEVLLLFWMLVTLVPTQSSCNSVLIRLILLVVTGAVLLVAGYFLTSYPAGHIRPSALHDALSYIFCALLAINYARLSDKYEKNLPAALLWAFLFSTFLALVLGVIEKDWSGINAMYYKTRWEHLSYNPNQFALLALVLPFLTLHLILRQQRNKILFALSAVCLLALALGFYSQSDALTVAWAIGGLVAAFALLSKRTETFCSNFTHHHSPHPRIIATLLILVTVTVSIWQLRYIAAEIIAKVQINTSATTENIHTHTPAITPSPPALVAHGAGDDPDQVHFRLDLWRNSLAVIQFAPVTGMGPGAHTGFLKPFEGREAHNTLLDWGTQTGLVGIIALTTYLIWMFLQVARQRQYELTAMLLALYCFSMFHNILRQPLFWITPLLAASLAVSNMRCRTSDRQI